MLSMLQINNRLFSSRSYIRTSGVIVSTKGGCKLCAKEPKQPLMPIKNPAY